MSNPKQPPMPLQVKIELDPETAQGVYVNMALVNHNETEFTLDCIYVQPQEPKGKVRARVITSPKHAKRLLLALQDSVANYERMFGTLDLSGGTPPPSGEFFN
jgi:hypothetical protein